MTLPLSVHDLTPAVVRRQASLFGEDVRQADARLREFVEGRRVLVVGAAGSIGAATVHEICMRRPASVSLVDLDENSLVELVRSVRSNPLLPAALPLDVAPIDAMSPLFDRMLAGREAFDVVFNFAAAKHVRGERDIVSTLHMLETNVLLATRLLDCLDSHSPHAPYFAVSTDKAANPASIMGASKRIMETVMFAHPSKRRITSARFANVAFSNGSLLDGWVRRLAKRQPLAVPANVRRYFVSLKEAGEICLLAAALCRDRQVAFPVLDSQTELQDLESVLARVLGLMRLEGLFVDNATTAQELMLTEDLSSRYPVLVSRADTAGEKPFEEFLSGDEVANALDGAAKLQATTPSLATAELSRSFCDWLATVCRNPAAVVEPDDLLGRISAIVPGFAHHASDASLDARM